METEKEAGRKTRTPSAPHVRAFVTTELIKEAVGRDSSHCAGGRAIEIAVPGARKVALDVQTVRFTHPTRSYRYTYLTPRKLAEFLTGWDIAMDTIRRTPLPSEQAKLIEELLATFPPFSFLLRGGQVTLAGRRSLGRKRKMTTRQRAAFEKARAVVGGKARLVQRSGTAIPDRVGGKIPPVSRRRSYGLRAYELNQSLRGSA